MSGWDRLEEAEAMLKFHLRRCGLAVDDQPLQAREEVLAFRLRDPAFGAAYSEWRTAREVVLGGLSGPFDLED